MAELGADASKLHADVGAHAHKRGIERLFAVGTLSAAAVEAFGAQGEHFEDKAALIAALQSRLHSGVTCLIKGSHSAGMEQVVVDLKQAALKQAASKQGALKDRKPGEGTSHAA
jgi:UDP-N-acetylmuramoyl-tripeptide--D-alanyl-D-alanine ligase